MNKKTIYTGAVLLVGLALAYLLANSSPERELAAQERTLRSVRVMPVQAEDEHLIITSQGSVQPRSQSELIPEVSGRVEWMSPSLVGGGSFVQGDVLLRVNSDDYRTALKRAQAASDRAQVEYEFTRDELARMEKLHRQNLASQSQLDGTQRSARIAEANLSESQAALNQATRDLQRTEITAPFDGLVRNEQVDVGQFVSRGNSIATIYATDFVEVRLPIAGDQLRFLGLDVAHRGPVPESARLPVLLSAEFGTTRLLWEGELVRTEAEIDERSRMIYGVARVEFDATSHTESIPVGLFVHAEIQGALVENAVRLPRSALRDNDQVLVVDEENRLRFRKISILRLEHDEVLVNSGLEDGELICISAIQTVVDGMQIDPVQE
ncbi:efflux RND transporter periplasmic adaptor subunit [Halioglobus maricola]|uniref:Efflux RND transporter periplasmic adaptor subunit n=1 Tax=Halioglobus maricola TaxID=2601894 RepID=A0A5P9NJU8_9GAMM|nr:efflux RND transporter periplasmic adaptor subunit [Halioglobus maricola]QFU75859.1 efflux RND transporter periplasmic adaptor subunit [Halioglobus maricola]